MQYETHGDYTILYIPHYRQGGQCGIDSSVLVGTYEIIIDTEDLEKAQKYNLVARVCSNHVQIAESNYGKAKVTYLTTILINLRKGERAKHINGKWNDFRKRNLKRIVPKQQQKEAMARLNALLGI